MSLRWLALRFALLGVSLVRADDVPPAADADASPYHQALLAYKIGHYDQAIAAIDIAEKANPDDLPTALLKARILTEQHEFAPAEKLLRHFLTGNGPEEVQVALADVLLRERSFARAAKYYHLALQAKTGDPDLLLKLTYAEINSGDLIDAGKNASQLKPLDPDHPAYYFARAALAQATGKTAEEEEDIQTARTIYGITVTNRYLKTYLQVFSSPDKNSAPGDMTPPPIIKPSPSGAK